MKAYNPNLELIVDVDASSYAGGGFDLPALNHEVDGFFVMSYHLRNPRSAEKAGSTNPISSLKTLSENFSKKVPSNKVIIAFPLYLAEWKTIDDSLHAVKKPGTGGGITVPSDCGVGGTTCTRLAQRYAKTYTKKYDTRDKAAYYSFYVCTGNNKNKGWRQVYFDDEKAFSDKFALANSKNLKGVGFWAQNYDEGYLDTWNAIYNQFVNKSLLPSPTKKSGFITPNPIPNNGCRPPTPTPTPTPTTSPGTSIAMVVGVDGIGETSRISVGGNLDPKHKTRDLEIKIYKTSDNSLTFFSTQVFTYSSIVKKFEEVIALPSSFQTGAYNLYVGGTQYLTQRYPGSVTITKNTQTKLNSSTQTFSLVSGDINRTTESINKLNILDYNVLLSCSVYARSSVLCDSNPSYKTLSDLTDDGKVDQDDFTLFLKELGNQSGDNLP